MRFTSQLLISSAVVVSAIPTLEPPLDYCTMLCSTDPNCDKERSSYCKSWLHHEICFAYYFETPDKEGPYYYHRSDDHKSTDTPMLCTDAESIVKPPAIDYCKLLCEKSVDCLASGQGSYLKTWQDPEVCFAFYFTDHHKTDYYFWTGAGGNEHYPLSNADAKRFVGPI